MAVDREQQLRAYVDYLRDMGVHDFYRRGEPVLRAEEVAVTAPVPVPLVAARPVVIPEVTPQKENVVKPPDDRGGFKEAYVPKPVSFNDLAPLPEVRVALADRADALRVIQEDIGDCTRCPLAYAGRRKIVFADGDPGARLMFVGEGPGADEDASGIPFVGKAGQLLNNMIVAMGLKREEVYIANIVKCRPPGNRTPEPVEANTCSQFLLRQMDVVQPEVVGSWIDGGDLSAWGEAVAGWFARQVA